MVQLHVYCHGLRLGDLCQDTAIIFRHMHLPLRRSHRIQDQVPVNGGGIVYRTEFMAACDIGQMCLMIRSILWDSDVPHEAATIAYDDGYTAMGNKKNTGRKPHKHIDIKYDTSHYANGSSATISTLNTSIDPSMWLTTLQNP